MTRLDEELLALSMQQVAATPADTTSLRDALWRRLYAEGWRPSLHKDRALGTGTSGTDRALLQEWLQGDPDAFEALVRRHGGTLLSYARRSLAEPEAQDAVQEAFIALFRKASDVLAKRLEIRAFLFGATRIEVRNTHRKRLRAENILDAYANEPAPDAPDVLNEILQREQNQLVRDLLHTCNELEQDVVVMTLAGQTNAEIATALEITTNHVGVLKHRAHDKLKRAIAQGREP
jgi:RNA polymerase sigma-70 factor (ECF subfamily)